METKGQSSRFATIEEIKEKSKQEIENAALSVLYLRGVTFERDNIVIDK